MKTTTPDTPVNSTETSALAPTTIFSLLANDRRRYVLRYLSQKVGAASLDDLAEQVALREGEPTADRYERILTDLHHTHLPKLVDGSVVRYDVERETVELRDAADELMPYLECVATADPR